MALERNQWVGIGAITTLGLLWWRNRMSQNRTHQELLDCGCILDRGDGGDWGVALIGGHLEGESPENITSHAFDIAEERGLLFDGESFEATSDELDCPSCKATPKERMGEPLCSTCNSCFECCETLCEDESFEAEEKCGNCGMSDPIALTYFCDKCNGCEGCCECKEAESFGAESLPQTLEDCKKRLGIAEEVLSMSDAVQTYNKYLLQEMGIDRYADDELDSESFGAEGEDTYYLVTFEVKDGEREYFHRSIYPADAKDMSDKELIMREWGYDDPEDFDYKGFHWVYGEILVRVYSKKSMDGEVKKMFNNYGLYAESFGGESFEADECSLHNCENNMVCDLCDCCEDHCFCGYCDNDKCYNSGLNATNNDYTPVGIDNLCEDGFCEWCHTTKSHPNLVNQGYVASPYCECHAFNAESFEADNEVYEVILGSPVAPDIDIKTQTGDGKPPRAYLNSTRKHHSGSTNIDCPCCGRELYTDAFDGDLSCHRYGHTYYGGFEVVNNQEGKDAESFEAEEKENDKNNSNQRELVAFYQDLDSIVYDTQFEGDYEDTLYSKWLEETPNEGGRGVLQIKEYLEEIKKLAPLLYNNVISKYNKNQISKALNNLDIKNNFCESCGRDIDLNEEDNYYGYFVTGSQSPNPLDRAAMRPNEALGDIQLVYYGYCCEHCEEDYVDVLADNELDWLVGEEVTYSIIPEEDVEKSNKWQESFSSEN